jgi:hypothetical protein
MKAKRELTPFTIADVTPEMRRPLLHVVAWPDLPNTVGGIASASSVHKVVLEDETKQVMIQPLSNEAEAVKTRECISYGELHKGCRDLQYGRHVQGPWIIGRWRVLRGRGARYSHQVLQSEVEDVQPSLLVSGRVGVLVPLTRGSFLSCCWFGPTPMQGSAVAGDANQCVHASDVFVRVHNKRGGLT